MVSAARLRHQNQILRERPRPVRPDRPCCPVGSSRPTRAVSHQFEVNGHFGNGKYRAKKSFMKNWQRSLTATAKSIAWGHPGNRS